MSDEAAVIDDTKPKRGRRPGQKNVPYWMRWPFEPSPELLLSMKQEQFDQFKLVLEAKWAKVLAARDASAGLTD